jgi:hypothetical protein
LTRTYQQHYSGNNVLNDLLNFKDRTRFPNIMSNNLNSMLTMFYILTFIVCLSFLETNTLSTFAQTDNIDLDNINASATSGRPLRSGFNSWICFTEFDHTDCMDMSNTSSTYLGLSAGATIGGVISWWVYNRQNKTSRVQDRILHQIEEIERKNREILTHLESYAKHHDLVLNKILRIDENIQALNRKIESTAQDQHS